MIEKSRLPTLSQLRIGTLLLLAGISILAASNLLRAADSIPEVQRRRSSRQTTRRAKPQINYARFSHRTHTIQQELPCGSCHKFPTPNWQEARKGDSAFPDVAEFPEHSSCLNCHRAQFFARERPAPTICSNCHVAVRPRHTARFLFPSLGDVSDPNRPWRDFQREFQVNFPHDKHLDVVGVNNRASTWKLRVVSWNSKQAEDPKSCAICHRTYLPQGDSNDEYLSKPPNDIGDNFWLKKGTFKTVPNSHTVCFTCHNTDTEIPPAPSDCSTCHQLGRPNVVPDFEEKMLETMNIADRTVLHAWERRISAGTFRHEGGLHPTVGCLSCHNIKAMNTGEPATLQVPVKSCGGAEGCHITATADEGGALNYELEQKQANASFICTKCHITFGKRGVPQGHLAAASKEKR